MSSEYTTPFHENRNELFERKSCNYCQFQKQLFGISRNGWTMHRLMNRWISWADVWVDFGQETIFSEYTSTSTVADTWKLFSGNFCIVFVSLFRTHAVSAKWFYAWNKGTNSTTFTMICKYNRHETLLYERIGSHIHTQYMCEETVLINFCLSSWKDSNRFFRMKWGIYQQASINNNGFISRLTLTELRKSLTFVSLSLSLPIAIFREKKFTFR